MAKSNNLTVGLEISDTQLILVHFHGSQDNATVKTVKAAPLPPRTVIDGEITDPSQLAEHMFKLLAESGIKAANVVVGINDMSYVKRVERMPDMPYEDTKAEVDIRVGQTSFLKGQDFQAAFMRPRIHLLSSTLNPPVLYAGFQKNKIDGIKSLVEADGFHLLSIELLPLAILRAITWKNPLVDDHSLTIILESNFIDLSILHQGDIIFTQTIRMDVDALLAQSSSDLIQTLVQKITLFLLTFSNHFPLQKTIEKGIFYSRLKANDTLFKGVVDALPNITLTRYYPRSNIAFDSKFPSADVNTETDHLLLASTPALGLALKSYEDHNQGINITRVYRTLGPLFTPKVAKKYGLIAILVIGLILGSSTLLNKTATRYQNSIKLTQDQLRSLQTGDYLRRQKLLKRMRQRISFLSQIQKGKLSNTDFLEKIVSGLPNDVSLSQLIVAKGNKVSIKGSSFSQDAIYQFYNHLKGTYKEVSISGITSSKKNDIMHHLFEIQFKRQP